MNLRAIEKYGDISKKIKITHISGGQLRPYSDSIYEYKVESSLPKNVVKYYCTTRYHKSLNEHLHGRYNGSCDFPFGLESYYKFILSGKHTYDYIVCEPYCG